MSNEREIYNFMNTLQLENYVRELRIAHAKAYLSGKIDLRNVSEEDCLAIYALLQAKDNDYLKNKLEEIRKM